MKEKREYQTQKTPQTTPAEVHIPVEVFQLYLRDLRTTPHLDSAENTRLAWKMQQGQQALEERTQHEDIDEPRHSELMHLEKEGLQARETLIEGNLRFVVSLAVKYTGRGLAVNDLIQEGTLGLIQAAGNYKPEKGFAFSTYAAYWIRMRITRAIENERNKTENPNGERTVFMEESAKKGSTALMKDIIQDKEFNTASIAEKKLLREDLLAALMQLSERERTILLLRWGMHDGVIRTLEEVGQIVGRTRARIQQIEAQALAKLRTLQISEKLRAYLHDE
jgi:RNA polymerase primary sigma factor